MKGATTGESDRFRSTCRVWLVLVFLVFSCVAGCAAQSVRTRIPDRWVVQTNRAFSFSGPRTLRKVPVMGYDSFVGSLENSEFHIEFDYGWYSNSTFDGRLGDKGEGSFQVEEVDINGKTALLGSYENNQYPPSHPFVYAAYFPDLLDTGETARAVKLYFRVCYRNRTSKAKARPMLTSIRLKH